MITFKQHLAERAQEERFNDYIKRLERIGIERLGNGLNSFVFKHPTMDHVAVKVFLDDDVGYREYLEFCMNHPQNKYTTKVLDTVHFAHERRSKYVTHELHANWNEERGTNPAYSITFLEMLKPVTPEVFESFLTRLASLADMDDITSLSKLGRAGWGKIAINDSDKDLQEFAKFLLAQIENGHKLDMGNRKNFMQRDGNVVFIDPFF